MFFTYIYIHTVTALYALIQSVFSLLILYDAKERGYS